MILKKLWKVEEIVKCMIISHGRANNVKSLKAFANVSICIAENQVEEYKKYNPGIELIVHPNNIVGLAMKYQWMYENYKNIAIIADDIDYFRRNYLSDMKQKKDVVDPITAYEIIQATAKTGKNLGAKLCAFSKESNPLTYSGHLPFKMSGLASGGVLILLEGWKNFKLSNRCILGLDYYMSGLNAYFNRICFIDLRFGVFCKEGTFISKGGMSEFRTIETEKSDFKFLKELFGDSIRVKKHENLRKKKHQFEKTLKIPF